MQHAPIEREIHIEADPETVFDVVSRPEHVAQWWSDEARFEVVAGTEGTLTWVDAEAGRRDVVHLTVVAAQRPHLFAFRWAYPSGETPRVGNSMLVEFRIEAEGTGTRLRMTESGLQEVGWDDEAKARFTESHGAGWDRHLPDLRAHAEAVAEQREPVGPAARGPRR